MKTWASCGWNFAHVASTSHGPAQSSSSASSKTKMPMFMVTEAVSRDCVRCRAFYDSKDRNAVSARDRVSPYWLNL